MMNKRNSTNGFTIIEMLVVITLTVILLGLIFGPVISSFNLTHQAQVMTEAQDTARQTLEQVQRELSQAMFVYDNTNSLVSFRIPQDPTDPSSPIQTYDIRFAKIDFVLPKLVMHCNNPDHDNAAPGTPRDYDRGDEAWPSCPECESEDVEARPIQPLRQDTTIVRYFIGLRDNDPAVPYVNIYDMENVDAEMKDNPYVLYRVEFDVYDDNLFPANKSTDERLLKADFFYDDTTAPNGRPIWENWRKLAKVVGHDEDIDMITIENGKPVPAVKFMPYGKDNDLMVATYLSDQAAEAPNACPTVFRASHGHWSPNNTVTVYSGDYSKYYSTYVDSANGDLWVIDGLTGNWLFNITNYRQTGQIQTDNDADMLFNVDPNKGEVTFNFNGSWTALTNVIENNFWDQYNANKDNEGVGMGERVAIIGGPAGLVINNGIRNAKIVPGTEQVVGPNMTPGPGYGRPVRYERVPLALGDPGLNQYKIDYNYSFDDNDDKVVAMIWFSSDPAIRLPLQDQNGDDASVVVSYQFHTNTPDQIVKADYDTKNLINIALAIRLYDSTSGKPMVVELNDQVQVRNVAR